jgi:hypothetical protein
MLKQRVYLMRAVIIKLGDDLLPCDVPLNLVRATGSTHRAHSKCDLYRTLLNFRMEVELTLVALS